LRWRWLAVGVLAAVLAVAVLLAAFRGPRGEGRHAGENKRGDGGKTDEGSGREKQARRTGGDKEDLRAVLDDYPLAVVKFTPAQKLTPTEGGIDATVTCSIDVEAYVEYAARLEAALKKVAERSGEAAFGVSQRGTLDFSRSGFSDDGGERVLADVLGDEKAAGCRLLFVCRSLRTEARAGWYLLRDSHAGLPVAAFDRAREVRLRCRLLDGDGGELDARVERPFRWPHSGKGGGTPPPECSLLPGGPAGVTRSVVRGEALDLREARRVLEEGKAEARRVMVILPAFHAAYGDRLSTSSDLKVRFDLTPRQQARAKSLSVQAEYPDAKGE
jgi:hypothetical protein